MFGLIIDILPEEKKKFQERRNKSGGGEYSNKFNNQYFFPYNGTNSILTFANWNVDREGYFFFSFFFITIPMMNCFSKTITQWFFKSRRIRYPKEKYCQKTIARILFDANFSYDHNETQKNKKKEREKRVTLVSFFHGKTFYCCDGKSHRTLAGILIKQLFPSESKFDKRRI